MLRDTLNRAVVSAYNTSNEDLRVQVLTRHDPDVNEYASRIRALKDAKADIIGFLDDDAMYMPDTIEKVLPYFKKGYGFVQGVVEVTGQKFAIYGTGVGTGTFIRKDAFDKIGYRFDLFGEEPRGTTGRGWRADSMLLADFLHVFGEDKYTLAGDVIIKHPEMMKGYFYEDREKEFYYNYKEYADKYILPIDPRLQVYLHKWNKGKEQGV